MRKRKKKQTETPPFPLREILQRYGVSQRQLARSCGLDEQTVSNLCNGRHQPTWKTILRVLTAIGADLGDLAPGKEGAA